MSAEDTKSAKDDKKKELRTVQSVPYLRLYRCADGLDYVLIVLGVLGSVVNGVTFPLFAVVFGELVDTFGEATGNFVDDVNQIALYFVYLACATLVASFFEVAMFSWAGIRQVGRLRQEYLEAALRQDITYYDTEGTSGDVLSALNDDCNQVQNAIGFKVGNVIHHIVTFFVAIGISLYRGWQLTLVMIALTPLIAVAGATVAKLQKMGNEKISAALSTANTASSQAIGNIRTVASFSAEERLYAAYQALLDFPTAVRIRLDTYGGMATGSVNAVVFFTYAVAFWYGAKLVREDSDYTGGVVMNVIFGAIIGGFALGQAAPNFSAFASGCTSAGRLLAVIERKPPIDVRNGGDVPSKPLTGKIELRGVHFAYAARPDVPVFKGLDLTIEAGQTVALVGASGCGKSTVIQLVERFYDPPQGTVTVDGLNVSSLDLSWYRSQVGLVSQEPTLFATTIKANILLGRPGASDADVREAAKAANAHNFIMSLPEGYDTQVGERGVQLSGGQKQRIAISRALLKNPRIMLLDEATSALDTRSERLVQAALDKLAVGRTTVVVAHRLSTIRNADQIAVVQGGKIVEKGTHKELYAVEGSVYHSLVKLQEQAGLKDLDTAEDDPDAPEPDALLDGAKLGEVAEDVEVYAQPRSSVDAAGKGLNAHTSMRTSQRLSGRMSAEAMSKGRLTSKNLDADDGKVDGKVDGKAKGKGKKKKEDELTEEEKKVKVGIRRLLRINASEWPYLVAGTLASAVLGSVMPLFAVLLSELIAVFFETDFDEAKRQALLYSMLFFALGIGQFIFATVQGYSFARSGARLAERVRMMLYRAILYMEVGWFDLDANTSGALVSRLSADAGSVRGAAGDVLGIALQNLVTVAVGYAIAFANGWRMTLVVTAVLPLLAFSSYMQMAFFFGLEGDDDEASHANQTAFEAVQAIRTVHSYGLEASVAGIYNNLLKDSHKHAQRSAVNSGAAFGAGQFIMFAVYALAFWFGGKEVEADRLNLEQMLKVFFSILLASMGASQAQLAFPDLAKGKVAVARIFRIVDRPSKIDASKDDGEKPAEVRGEVRLTNVDFSYPSRPDVPVFRNFSLHVPAGKVTALVGESGSGKSTIISLVERFYDVAGGQVFLDGVDVRQLSVPWLRAHVGLVAQEPALFNGTILDNIRFGKPDASIEEVRAAAAVANAIEFIERQPDGLGTLLGEGGGISLSGGQKQRIAIARAVLKDPRVLLLDEATSALDAESERLVQDALDKLMVGRTSIVVAHRLTTIRNADKIAVVQRGQVLEEGTHDELMAKGDGAYVQLARAQAGQSFT